MIFVYHDHAYRQVSQYRCMMDTSKLHINLSGSVLIVCSIQYMLYKLLFPVAGPHTQINITVMSSL